MVEPDSIRVRDLGSTNGTFIDDVRIEEAPLLRDNCLRLGNVVLQLEQVAVTPVGQVSAPSSAPAASHVEIVPVCAYHAGARAAFRCENCGGCFCSECVTVVGQGKFSATTICPVCKDQCYPLPAPQSATQEAGILRRLTQTLKIPFSR